MTPPKGNKDMMSKGIRSLLQGIDSDLKNASGALKNTVIETVTSIQRIPVTEIEANPSSPEGILMNKPLTNWLLLLNCMTWFNRSRFLFYLVENTD